MNVHVAVAETLARRKVEVAHDLVDANPSLNAASLTSLFIQMFSIVLPLALLDILSTSERPGFLSISLSYFGTGIAASGFRSSRRCRRSVAFSAVIWLEVDGWLA